MKDTIWETMRDDEVPLDLQEVEELFSMKVVAKATAGKVSSSCPWCFQLNIADLDGRAAGATGPSA